jgi:hypothetical protein
MWEFPDIKQNRTLYAQANSNLPIRIQTVEQLIGRSSKQQRAAGCYYNRQQTRSSLAADITLVRSTAYKDNWKLSHQAQSTNRGLVERT